MIDVHFHAFNLRSVPLAGVIEQLLPMSPSRGRRGFARFLDFVFTAMTRHDRTLDPAEGRLSAMAEAAGGAFESEKERAYRGSPAGQDPRARRLPAEWQTEEEVRAFVEAIPEDVLMHEFATECLGEAQGFRAIEMRATGVQDRRGLVRGVLPHATQEHREALGVGIGGGLAFVGNMMAKERTLVNRVRENTPGAGLFVHLMMHMDPSFEDTSYYSYPRQIARVRALCAHPYVGGRVCAFVAFNAYDASSVATVKRALHNGFVGVKFYPPMGYRASGNTSVLPWRGDVTPAVIESRVRELFALCVSLDVPIMAHCTPQGMEADPRGKSGLNSDPVHWRSVLREHPSMRLCFAHAGDHAEWFESGRGPTAWRDAVVDLCVQHEHVYCDLSHMGDVLAARPGNPDVGRDALRASLRAVIGGQPRFAEKIMYGSDYPMPLPAKGWKRFYPRMRSVFDDRTLEPHIAHVFYENARRYLAMGAFLRRNEGVLTDRERGWQSQFA
jgi:predicted TIM-barrel fold metal-dependent hydrolase